MQSHFQKKCPQPCSCKALQRLAIWLCKEIFARGELQKGVHTLTSLCSHTCNFLMQRRAKSLKVIFASNFARCRALKVASESGLSHGVSQSRRSRNHNFTKFMPPLFQYATMDVQRERRNELLRFLATSVNFDCLQF